MERQYRIDVSCSYRNPCVNLDGFHYLDGYICVSFVRGIFSVEFLCTSNPWAKTIKKNRNSTQNKSQTQRARAYEVTSFLSTDCELSTETCSKMFIVLFHVIGGRKREVSRQFLGWSGSGLSNVIIVKENVYLYIYART